MKKRGMNKKAIRRLLWLVIASIAIVVFINQFSRISYYNGQIKDLEGQIAEQEETAKELEEKSDVYSSREHVEKIARDELGLLRANEKVYIDSNQQ